MDLIGLGLQTRRRPVLRESAALALLCTADMISTLYVVRTHMAVETNPLFVGPLAHSDVAFLTLKAASYLVPIAILELIRPVRPEAVALYLLGSGGVRLAG